MLRDRLNHQSFWQRKAIYGKGGKAWGETGVCPKPGSRGVERSPQPPSPDPANSLVQGKTTPRHFGTSGGMEKSQGASCQGRIVSSNESRTARDPLRNPSTRCWASSPVCAEGRRAPDMPHQPMPAPCIPRRQDPYII